MEEQKEHTHKWYTFGCKDATYLTVKNDFAPLSSSEKILLKFHMIICKYCRRFVLQNKKINTQVKESYHNNHLTLSFDKKEALNQLITKNLNK